MKDLPKEWDSFTSSLRARPSFDTDDFIFEIQREAKYRASMEETSKPEKITMTATKQSKCFNCNKLGHIKKDCWAPGGGKEGQFPKKRAMKATKLQKAEIKSEKNGNYAMNVTKEKSHHAIIMDSGASHHMTGDLNSLENYKESPEESIYLANNAVIKSKGTGQLRLKYGNIQLTFSSVLFVPELGKTIISVDQLIKKSYQVIFDNNPRICTASGKMIIHLTKNGNLFELPAKLEKRVTYSADKSNVQSKTLFEWHRSLGHLNYKDVKKLSKCTTGMRVTDTKEKQCETCIEGKMTRFSFQTKNQPTELSIQPGEVWSTDLGFVKNIIYVTFVDNCTGVTYLAIIQRKNEASEALTTFLNLTQ